MPHVHCVEYPAAAVLEMVGSGAGSNEVPPPHVPEVASALGAITLPEESTNAKPPGPLPFPPGMRKLSVRLPSVTSATTDVPTPPPVTVVVSKVKVIVPPEAVPLIVLLPKYEL